MLDINQYTYTTKPYTATDKFVVHPLNELGTEQYYAKDSHTHTYVDKINPRKMQKIYAEKEELDKYYDQILKERQTTKDLKYGITPKNNESVNVFQNEQIENQDNQDNQDNQYNQANQMEENIQNNYYGNRSRTADNFYSHRQTRPAQKLDEKLATFGNSNFGKRYNVNIKLPDLTKKKSKRFNVSSVDKSQPNTFFTVNKKKIGFESYNIPRVDPKTMKVPVSVNEFNKKCYQSLTNGFYKSQGNNFGSYLDQENSRLTSILLNQTSEGFLKQSKLPKISYIVNQPTLVIKKTGIGNSKFMGSGYNPHNYNYGLHKNMTKRNDTTGALYLH